MPKHFLSSLPVFPVVNPPVHASEKRCRSMDEPVLIIKNNKVANIISFRPGSFRMTSRLDHETDGLRISQIEIDCGQIKSVSIHRNPLPTRVVLKELHPFE